MIYPKNFENKVDFAAIRNLLKAKCLCALGVQCCDEMAFSTDYGKVCAMLEQTNEFLSIIESGVEFPLNHYFDLTQQLETVRAEGSFLTESELFNLKRSLSTIADIARFFKSSNSDDGETPQYPRLTDVASTMTAFPDIIDAIDAVLDKFGNIKDNATPELLAIKRQIASTTSSINGILRRILSTGRNEGYIEKDAAPSIRDGRLVIPVAPMNKRKIKGIVHDESATGKTIFIEPAEIVEANNAIRELEGEMHREIVRILLMVTSTVRPHIDDMIESYRTLGLIDFIRAKALFAQEIGGCLPTIEKKPQIEWYHAIHPLLHLTLKAQGKSVVPLNISLDSKSRILIISGPNAGGKSVCLKTVSVVQYMTQCGLLPPVYSNSHIGIFRNIFVDIGDEQSIENDLSTYSSHLMNMKFFINNGGRETLTLIDEFGGGTEPQIGGAIAQAILARFNAKQMFGVITTHYQNLKHFAEENDGIVNGAMLYDRQHMQPLFQLSIGYPGSSFAVEIARKIGLPADVIADAEQIVGSDYINMDKYLLDIARDRKYWEGKRQEIHGKEKRLSSLIEKYESEVERLSGEQRDIIKAAKAEAKEILARSNASIERTIHEIKKAQAEKEKTKEIRRQLDEFKERLEADDEMPTVRRNPELRHKQKGKKNPTTATDTPTQSIGVNDYVYIDGGNSKCLVLEVSGKTAIVAIGEFKSKIELSRLTFVSHRNENDRKVAFVSSSTTDSMRQRQLNFKQDIDVRGMRADEAIQTVTYFIDDALQFNAQTVRILHGTGNGILRTRIREYLNTVAGVKSYRDEHVQLGGAGITVIDLG